MGVLNQQTILVAGEEFGGWCKGKCWNVTLLGKEIKQLLFLNFIPKKYPNEKYSYLVCIYYSYSYVYLVS